MEASLGLAFPLNSKMGLGITVNHLFGSSRDEQAAIINDIYYRMFNLRTYSGSTFSVDFVGTELPFELVACRSGFNQRHVPTLISEVEMTIGIKNRGTACSGTTLRSPGIFASHHVETNGKSLIVTMSAINVIANQEHAAMMVLEFLGFQKVFFLLNILPSSYHDLPISSPPLI